MKGSGMPWPGDESEERWTQAWTAIKRVCLLIHLPSNCHFKARPGILHNSATSNNTDNTLLASIVTKETLKIHIVIIIQRVDV